MKDVFFLVAVLVIALAIHFELLVTLYQRYF
jgi:hypothetical protein